MHENILGLNPGKANFLKISNSLFLSHKRARNDGWDIG